MRRLIFHVGLHKTGTTWLQKGLLREHPEINLCNAPSAPWDDRFLSYVIGCSDRRYSTVVASRFLESVLEGSSRTGTLVDLFSAERLSGHPWSGGYDTVRIARRLKDCAPNAEVMVSIRNQVDMVKSVYKQLVVEGYVGTFAELLSGAHWKGVGFDLEMYEYDVLIDLYRELFGRERVLVLTYEELRGSPATVVSKVGDFLGVSPMRPTNLDRRTNVSVAERDIALMRLGNRCRRTELNPHPLKWPSERLAGRVSRFAGRLLSRDALFSEEELDVVRRRFVESNVRLRERLPEADLSAYCV